MSACSLARSFPTATAGSVRAWNILRVLLGEGYHVTLVPTAGGREPRYAARARALGVDVQTPVVPPERCANMGLGWAGLLVCCLVCSKLTGALAMDGGGCWVHYMIEGPRTTLHSAGSHETKCWADKCMP